MYLWHKEFFFNGRDVKNVQLTHHESLLYADQAKSFEISTMK